METKTSAVIEIGSAEFEARAVKAEGLVLVDFSAPWCGPCRRMEPELEAVATEMAGKATFFKVNVDESPDIAMKYGVQGIPNLTFLKGGEVVDVAVGAMQRAAILSRVQKLL
jgi:thioredoxin